MNTIMQIKEEYRGFSAEEIWQVVSAYAAAQGRFFSVTGNEYVVQLRANALFYKGGCGKRAREGEYLDRQSFIDAYRQVRDLPVVNTCTVKRFINRRQTSFIGLLLSAGILLQ